MQLKNWGILKFYEKIKRETENGNQAFSLIRLPFAHRANGSLFVHLYTYKETNEIYPFAKGLNGLNRHVHLWLLFKSWYYVQIKTINDDIFYK
jgi:hypothetical protein